MIAPTHGVGAVPAADEIGVERSESFSRLLLRAFAEHRLALVGVGIIVFMILFSFVGPLFYVTDQVHTNPLAVTQAPSAHHLLGTDDVGYDVLGRLMLAGQSSLEVAVAAAILASTLGTAWGAIAGYFGGAVDSAMMRLGGLLPIDSAAAVHPLLASVFTPTVPVLILVIALISWLGTARLVRGECLSLRVREYVLAAIGMAQASRGSSCATWCPT